MELIFVSSALLVFAFMVVMFAIATAIKDNSIVDIGWGLGFAIVAFAGLLHFTLIPGGRSFSTDARPYIATAMVLIWGLRLTAHIFFRNKGKAEDPRYAKWRQDWGKWVVPRAFLQVFMLQGLIMWVVLIPVMMILAPATANHSPLISDSGLNWLDFGGIAIWSIGFFFEAVGDWQLMRFTRNPSNKGKLLTTGLWRYSRHPNYFGEAFLWWGILFMALNTGPWWLALIGPLAINFFLAKVSGVPMLEEYLSKKPGWEEYKRKTSALFPWFPGK